MGRSQRRKVERGRVGQVSYYRHHGGWWLYYREHGRPVRRRVADGADVAAQIAAQVNAQLAVAAPTMFSFTPLPIAELRRRFLDYHEHVLRSSLATVARYRAASQHLENFALPQGCNMPAYELDVEQFVRYLRTVNGGVFCVGPAGSCAGAACARAE